MRGRGSRQPPTPRSPTVWKQQSWPSSETEGYGGTPGLGGGTAIKGFCAPGTASRHFPATEHHPESATQSNQLEPGGRAGPRGSPAGVTERARPRHSAAVPHAPHPAMSHAAWARSAPPTPPAPPLQPLPGGPAPSSPPLGRPGYDPVEGRPAPLEDLADACAVLPAGLALPDQGGVGGE